MWKPEMEYWMSFSTVLRLFLDSISGVYQVYSTGWPVNSEDPPASPGNTRAPMAGVHTGHGDMNPGPQFVWQASYQLNSSSKPPQGCMCVGVSVSVCLSVCRGGICVWVSV